MNIGDRITSLASGIGHRIGDEGEIIDFINGDPIVVFEHDPGSEAHLKYWEVEVHDLHE